ncbi:phosphatase PAP2 family protein [[Clostridium] fimetarium]|uniref:PAP2 superfamily protein n=1 Tax=[Clostridium] fimetarium TaxID=99656 RepID=A0A1I0RJB5_9FIRM|nr:phosphatase PAP2 family protein [[Clostridium] fimetarium]SEW40364.1 PAP2 superfamily protein [[Clostridium] fimetarium]
MNEINYAKIRLWLLAENRRIKSFMFLYKTLPLIVFISYIILCGWLFINGDTRIFKVILIPLVIFVLVSIIRKIIDSPRPYVVLNIEPLVKKDKVGESFPSRHVLSVCIIAVACFYINPWLGVFMSVIASLIAIIRVLAGVHFIKDVIVGAFISYVIGGLSFWLF